MWMQPNWLVGVTYFSGALWILVFVTMCFNPNQQFKQLLRSDTHPNSTGTPWWQSLNEHLSKISTKFLRNSAKKVDLCAFPSTTAVQIFGVGSSVEAFGGTYFFFAVRCHYSTAEEESTYREGALDPAAVFHVPVLGVLPSSHTVHM